jgi:hypothetical protein
MPKKNNRKCQKVKHSSKEAAIIAMKKIGFPAHLHAYECPKCKVWHLGRSNKEYATINRINQLLDQVLPKTQKRYNYAHRGIVRI